MAKKLLILFQADDQRFAISAKHIVEITPLVELINVPKTRPYISGLFNYRGTSIPVIDTNMLLFNKPSSLNICTRIIVLSNSEERSPKYVGLIAEKVNKTINAEFSDISNHTLTEEHDAYLGKIFNDHDGEIQILDVEKLLPQEANCLMAAINAA